MFKSKLKLAKGTRFTSALFITVSLLIAAGVMWGADMYYDIDTGKIMVEQIQEVTQSLRAVGGLVVQQGASITGGLTVDQATTTATSTVQGTFIVDGNMIFGSDADDTATFNADIASNLIPSSDADYDLGTSTARWRNIYVGTTTIGDTIIIGNDTIEATSSLTIKAAGAGDDITISANDTLDIDAATTTIDGSTAIYIGTTADRPIDIDSSTLDIDASGNITIDTSGANSIALTSGDDFTITFDADDAFSLTNGTEFLGISTADVVTLGDDAATTTIDGSTITLSGTSQVDGTLTVGDDAAGYTVTFYGDTAGQKMVWDDANKKLVITGTAAANALEIASGDVNVQGKITVGENNTGYDVTFYGATAGVTMLWDENLDKLVVTGVSGQEALRIATGNAVIAAGNLAITNPTTLSQVALTVTQSTTTQDIVQFIGETSDSLAIAIDANGYITITASDKLTIASGDGADLILDSASGYIYGGTGWEDTIRALKFESTSTDASVRKTGDQIVREIVPIFGFDLPAQTASTSYVTVSRHLENYPFPEQASGTTRVHKFVFRYSASSTSDSDIVWRVATSSGTHSSSTLSVPSSDDLQKGEAYISATTSIPSSLASHQNWWIDVKTPDVETTVRIFQILLVAYDQVN